MELDYGLTLWQKMKNNLLYVTQQQQQRTIQLYIPVAVQ